MELAQPLKIYISQKLPLSYGTKVPPPLKTPLHCLQFDVLTLHSLIMVAYDPEPAEL